MWFLLPVRLFAGGCGVGVHFVFVVRFVLFSCLRVFALLLVTVIVCLACVVWFEWVVADCIRVFI